MKLSDLKINPRNPRICKDNKFKDLVRSIQEFPKMMELRPIIVDEDMMILGGNLRFRALKELKFTDIPNSWVKKAKDLSEDEKKRFIIVDNLPIGEHDYDMLANEWDELELEHWGLDFPHLNPENEDKSVIASEKKLKTCPECGHTW